MNKHPFAVTIRLSLWLLVGFLVACNGRNTPPPTIPAGPAPVAPIAGLELEAFLGAAERPYLSQLSFTPDEAQYYPLINDTLRLTPQEIEMLAQNGFVVSDRLAFEDFSTAYAYIYWKDLPVLVTTDSMLQTVHETYDDLLQATETTILYQRLKDVLSGSRLEVKQLAAANRDPALAPLYRDVEIYLTVPLALLSEASYDTAGTTAYVALAESADSVQEISLFGSSRQIDFTLFQPRGHYTEFELLSQYFRAMMWLAQIDFRLLEYDEFGQPQVNPSQIAAAAILRQAIDESNYRPSWEAIDSLFNTLIGRSDNTTLPDLDRFLQDAGLDSGAAILAADEGQLLNLLTTNDYGQQRITGQLVQVSAANSDPVPRPVSFALLGQRFTVDAYWLGNVVYDRLLVDGRPVQRPLPSPLDVMYVLGNDRAATHLEPELEEYEYQGNLAALRQATAGYPATFWSDSVYNQWLGALRPLSGDTTGNEYPQAMRTAAWADKMLHTQLASWAQLRHDNILYVKQSITVQVLCEYPAGYVEPYPDFYAALRQYAQSGRAAFEGLTNVPLGEQGQEIRQTAINYFNDLEGISAQLQTMAEKELRLEEFTAEEELFLKSIAIRQVEELPGCGGPVFEEHWDGWYMDLLPWRDDSPALISDIHTNPNNDPAFADLLPPSVLHVGTGPVAAVLFIADTDEGPTLYVGPAFTYFETVEEGYPPVRLTDEDWDGRLSQTPYPAAPPWTASFRLPVSEPPRFLRLPAAE